MKKIIIVIALLLFPIQVFWFSYGEKDIFFWKIKTLWEKTYIHQFIRYKNIGIENITQYDYVASWTHGIDITEQNVSELQSGDIVAFHTEYNFSVSNMHVINCSENIYTSLEKSIFMQAGWGLTNQWSNLKNITCNDLENRFTRNGDFPGLNYFWFTSGLNEKLSLEEQFHYYQNYLLGFKYAFIFILWMFIFQNIYLLCKRRKS